MNMSAFLLSLPPMNPVPPFQGTYDSPVGLLSISANDVGVCSISFDENIGSLGPTNPVVEHTIGELHEYFSGKRQTFSVALAPRGTTFEESVWMALLTIG